MSVTDTNRNSNATRALTGVSGGSAAISGSRFRFGTVLSDASLEDDRWWRCLLTSVGSIVAAGGVAAGPVHVRTVTAPPGGELDRVANQIPEDLLKSRGVRADNRTGARLMRDD